MQNLQDIYLVLWWIELHRIRNVGFWNIQIPIVPLVIKTLGFDSESYYVDDLAIAAKDPGDICKILKKSLVSS